MAACILVSPFGAAADSLPGGTHFVTDNVRLAPLSDTHKAKLVDYLDAVDEEALSRNVRNKPAFVIPYSEVAFLKGVGSHQDRNSLALQLHRFALEYFSEAALPMAAFSFDGSAIISHTIDQDGNRFRDVNQVTLPQSAWEKQVTYLKFLYGVMSRAPAADIVIDRLSRAFRSGANADGIIDIAIALESLVSAKLEIKFQFSLYNSLINVASLEERLSVFTMLQVLYDVRSFSVHGSKPGRSEKRKLKDVADNWSRLINIARTNLTYYAEFCRINEADKWGDHLKSLALGGLRVEVGA